MSENWREDAQEAAKAQFLKTYTLCGLLGFRPAVGAALDVAATALSEEWREDPSADERWNAGLDYAMTRFCHVLGINPKDVTWDAATEELDGDVCAVIGNILRLKFGDDFDPTAPVRPVMDDQRGVKP